MEKLHDLLHRLRTGPDGLSPEEAARRLEEHGANRVDTDHAVHPLILLLRQFKSFIIYILLFAVVFSLAIGEYSDSVVILVILVANALIGFQQEYRAQKSLGALKRLTTVRARARRGGRVIGLDSTLLVPGDVVLVEAGDKVPADCRLLAAVRLRVDESALTGESEAVGKAPSDLAGLPLLGERTNMLFSATSVVLGSGEAVVTTTGMATEIGRITALLREVEEEHTPLQQRLDRFGRRLGQLILLLCALIFGLLLFKEQAARGAVSHAALVEFAFIAISLAVAAVPTALPAVVTIALSIGVKRLLDRKALVRRLSSVETLGSCDVICTDKTGTLTQNRMTVRRLWTPAGETLIGAEVEGPVPEALLAIGLACNNAMLEEGGGGVTISGDPTEAALLVSARLAGVEIRGRRVDELPFDGDRKMMSVVMEEEEGVRRLYTKGAPDRIIEVCDRVLVGDEIRPLTQGERRRILAQNEAYAAEAMRVLGFAWVELGSGREPEERAMVFVGLQAMLDPPRPDVAASIARARRAGIRTIMITGDYAATGAAIGREVGITGAVLTGAELDAMDDRQLGRAVLTTNVFARVAPEHKQRIVRALQAHGHTVAMTGDGVNDAPALKKADIGIAVGSGTEVAREASDFVLLDDSFTLIAGAIEEGRGIYENIQKSIMLLLSGNVGEVLIIFSAVVLGLNLPLTAILLLWINMVTDGAPALAFSVDPYGSGLMERLPKPRHEAILPRNRLAMIITLGALGTAIAMLLFQFTGGASSDPDQLRRARTVVFNFVVLYELILVYQIRVDYGVGAVANPWMGGAIGLSLGLQALLMYTPLAGVFDVAPLAPADLGLVGWGGVVFFLVGLLYLQVARRIALNRAASRPRS